MLFLPKEEGGQGLTHVASRGAASPLQFIPKSLAVRRPIAGAILGVCGGLGLALSCFNGPKESGKKQDDVPRF